MDEPVYSPDGKFLWTGSDWIPAPPEGGSNNLNMQDSVIGGDVISNTTINNDPSAVTEAVITALQEMGMLGRVEPQAPPVDIELPQIFNVGDYVEYYSPTNNRWIGNSKVTSINDDGTYKIEVKKSSSVETKHAVVIGTSPGTIRPATKPFDVGSRVFVNWKGYGHYYAGTIAKENPNDTYLIHFDDGDVEDNVDLARIESLNENSEAVKEYIERDTEAEEELIEAFKVFDTNNSGTILAKEYFEILTQMGDNPLSVDDVLNEFAELGISMDSQIDYRELAKFIVASESDGNFMKVEVIIRDAYIEGNILHGYAYDHPKLGESHINTSEIISITYDERATARVETQNTIYVVGPTGWVNLPDNHPFNDTSNQFYTVQGAGIAKCNGTYIPATEFDGVLSYINGDVLLLRWKMGNGDQWWYLADRNSLDTKRGDYYRVRSSSDTPPKTGWIIDDQTEGIMPCPTISGSANQPTLSTYSAGNQVKVEWNGSWWDALIRDINGDKYLIHYVGFDSSWDEWVDSSRIKTV
ncbi:MAG: hypothetical protein CMB20_005140 [Methanobacteriota archaeon]|nr:MAG: hypothetical protein CMB20_005140 [Euryarchaeota archaeon]